MATAKQTKNTDQLKPHQWKPGQSGNPNGRPKGTSVRDEIERQLKEDPSRLTTIVSLMLKECQRSDVVGLRNRQELFDRLDGKPIQVQKVSGDGEPITLRWPWQMTNGNHPTLPASDATNGSGVSSEIPRPGVRAQMGKDAP